MNKGSVIMLKYVAVILLLGETNCVFNPSSCNLFTDGRLNTNLTLTVEHVDSRTGVWIMLAAEFFDYMNVICTNIYINGSTPNNCEIPEGNICINQRCWVKLTTDALIGGTDTVTFTGMNYPPGSEPYSPQRTYAYTEYMESISGVVCDEITLPRIYDRFIGNYLN